MATAATQARQVRPRGLAPVGTCVAVAFLLVSLAVGLFVGPVDVGFGGILAWARR
jgi:hypothetical protein